MLKTNCSAFFSKTIFRWGFFGIPFSLIILETITYPGLLNNKLGIEAYWIVTVWLAAAFLISLIKKQISWPPLINKHLTIPLGLATLLLWISTLAENYYYHNYIFATYGINILGLVYILYMLLGIAGISIALSLKPALKKLELCIFLVPFAILSWAYYMQSIHYVLFRWFVREDGIVEVAQVIMLLIAAYACFRLFLSQRLKNKISAWLLVVMCLGFVVVAAEEISWGQRIFEWDTPEHYAEVNMQRETNLHNHQAVFGTTMRIYVLIGMLGSFLWITTPLLRRVLPEGIIKLTVPKAILAPYFLPSLMYNYYRVAIGTKPMDKWEEVTELLLYMAIALHCVAFYKWYQRIEKVKKIKLQAK